MKNLKYLSILLLASSFVVDAQTQKNSSLTNYRVMSEAYVPPFIYRTPQGRADGFEVDILNAIAAKEGFTLTFDVHDWEGLFDTLNNGRSDIIASNITITEARRKMMDFTNPYFESIQTLLFNPKKINIQSSEQIANLKIAVQKDTTSESLSKKLTDPRNVVKVNGTYGAVKKMLMRKADAALSDSGSIAYYNNKFTDLGLKTFNDPSWPVERYGFAVKKGNSNLLKQLNEGLEAINADGTYQKIYKKWFEK